MDTKLIRTRLNPDPRPFVFRLSDGPRGAVAHPDFAAASPGQGVVINPKTEGITRVDPLHIVALEEQAKRRSKPIGHDTH